MIFLKRTKKNKGRTKSSENLKEISKIILYIIGNSRRPVYLEKLEKMLFYTQFLHYNNHNEIWLKNTFTYEKTGVTLKEFNSYIKSLQKAKIISIHNNGYGMTVVSKNKIAEKHYGKRKIETLQSIIKKFENYSSSDMINYCKKEPALADIKLSSDINLKISKDLMKIYTKLSA